MKKFLLLLCVCIATSAFAVETYTVKRGGSGSNVPAPEGSLLVGVGGSSWVLAENNCLLDTGVDPPTFTCGGSGSSLIIQNEGSPLTARPALNFIGGSVNCVDNSGASRTDCTFTDAFGYDRIQDEASDLTKRPTVNFIGSSVSCVDNAGSTRTDCTFTTDGVGYDEVLDEASSLTKRSKINFIGSSISCVDNAGSTRTDCTLTAASALTVQEADGSPSVTSVSTLSFDQSDGFTVTNSGSGVATIDFTSAGSGGGCPWNYVVLSSDFTTALNTDPAVTAFNFTPVASKLYVVEGQLYTRSANITIAPRPGISWPTGLTDNVGWMNASDGSASNKNRFWDGTTTQNATITDIATANVSQFSMVTASFKTGVSPSGNFQITLSAEGALGNVTMKANSWFRYKVIVNGAESCGGTNHNLLSTTHTDTASHTGVAGDIIYFDGSSWRDLPKGNNGQMLTLVGGLPRWVNPSVPTPCDETTSTCFFDDFNENADNGTNGTITDANIGPWAARSAGTGAQARTVTGGNTLAGGGTGLSTTSLRLEMGSSAGGEACVNLSGPALLGAGNAANTTARGKSAFRWSFRTGVNLSNVTDRYIYAIGANNSGSCNVTANTSGMGFMTFYSDNVNGGRFEASASSGAGTSTCDTGVTAVADTTYKGCMVFSTNSCTMDVYLTTTLSALDCRDPDNIVGTPQCTITGNNIPGCNVAGGSENILWTILQNKTAGTNTSRTWHTDYFGFYQASDTAR